MDDPYHALALGQAVSETLCDIVDSIEADYAVHGHVSPWRVSAVYNSVFQAMDDEDAVFHALWASTLDDDDPVITCRRVLEF